jgi:hypothetical protein
LNIAWSIVNKSAEVDDKTRLQALALINDCNKYKMDLTTNGVVITDGIKYVQSQTEHLNKAEKPLLSDIKKKEENQSNESSKTLEDKETTNGVF